MRNQHKCKNNQSGRAVGGIVLLGLGIFFLGRNLGLNIPDWIFSWSTFAMLFGLALGFKNQFRSGGWLVLTLVGAFFTADKIMGGALNLSKYTAAMIFITLGLYLMFKRKKSFQNPVVPEPQPTPFPGASSEIPGEAAYTQPVTEPANSPLETLESVNIFGGSHQKIFSKSFRGGDVVAVFGGCDVNLSQADIQGVVVIEIVAVCGGVKLVVPAGWQVQSEMTAILGGLDDKRGLPPFADGPAKTLVVKGLALCGGVEIKNF